jgi:hypothetical protein
MIAAKSPDHPAVRKRMQAMDFIERIFHVNPDGGSGTLESMFVLALISIVLLIVYRLPVGVRSAKRAKV